MMNKTKFLGIAVVALLALNIGTIAFFTLKNPPRHMEAGPRNIIVERLHFDAEQEAAYDALIAKHRLDIRAKNQEIAAAKTALYTLLQSGDFSKKDSLITAIGQLQQQVENIHFQHFGDIKNLCKGEQIQAFNEMTADLAGYFSPKGKRNKKPD